MKATSVKMFKMIWVFLLLTAAPAWTFAQGQEGAQRFKQEELAQMLAPIALYPDSLLAQVLMAATYPLEVVEADRWVKANRDLKGDALSAALEKQDWDPSVKALAPFPQVLAMLSDRLEWMQKLGDAFLEQEEDVTETVQELRAKAEAAGNLKTNDEQKVVVKEKVIQIEPVTPEVVYVPAYNPAVVYGPWWYPAYPPFFYYPPGVVLAPGAVWWYGPRIFVGPAWFAWGRWDWHHRSVYVNINRNVIIHRTDIRRADIQTAKWQHDARHRKGVAYREAATRERFGQAKRPGAESRRDFRGFEGRDRPPSGSLRQDPERRRELGGGERHGVERGRDRSAFGAMEQGGEARRQSERGRQSVFSRERIEGGRGRGGGGLRR